MSIFRVNSITFENYKFFSKPFIVDLKGGKNLLVYGENGSGKSSIYWGLHSFLQSSIKDITASGGGKYFDKSHPESLCNIHAKATDGTGIKVEFLDPISKSTFGKQASNTIINTTETNGKIVVYSLFLSDFINFNQLSRLHNFRNSEICDVSEFFIHDIFPMIRFNKSYKDIDGNEISNKSVADWWDYIQKAKNLLPHRTGNNGLNRYSQQYNRYKDLIDLFNAELKSYLQGIQIATNGILKTNYHINDTVELTQDHDVQYDYYIQKTAASRRSRCRNLDRPQIVLRANVVNPDDNSIIKKIEHLSTYYNEAKLTLFALSIRQAILQDKYALASTVATSSTDHACPILCVDDVMTSMDMSSRVLVSEVLVELASKYQMFIFTHDIALFNLLDNCIKDKGDIGSWNLKKMYRVDEADVLGRDDVPHPIFTTKKTYLENAKVYYSKRDYPACANNLRRYLENILKKILPRNLQLCVKSDESIGISDLSKLIDKLPQFYDMYQLPIIFPHIHFYRQHILNPLSHDDAQTPAYKEEMKRAIKELEEYKDCLKRKIIVKQEDCPIVRFRMEVTVAGTTLFYEFSPIEQFDYLTYTIKDPISMADVTTKHYKSAAISIINRTVGLSDPTDNKTDIRSYYDMLNQAAKAIDYTWSAPSMESIIARISDGVLLSSI